MTWLILVIIFSLIVSFVVLKGIATVRRKFDQYEENSVIDLFMDFPKCSIAVIIICILGGLYSVSHYIGQMYDCQIRSFSQEVDTQYSWYYDECRFKNDKGVWVPFKNLRGTPGSEEEGYNE